MSQLIVFEDSGWQNLLPLTYWRAVGELRCGRRTLADQAASWMGAEAAGWWVRPEISAVVAQRTGDAVPAPACAGSLLVNARWLAEGPIEQLRPPVAGTLEDEIAFVLCDEQLAGRLNPRAMLDAPRASDALQGVPRVPARGRWVRWPWDLLERGAEMLLMEWRPQEAARRGDVDVRAFLIDDRHIHVGAGAVVQPGAVLDGTTGPVYIDAGARVRSHAIVEGPAYIGRGSQIHPGAWIHGATIIGAHCKVGGEVCDCVLQDHVNKQHHGFLGHSAVGGWVNLGAGTTTSNLKNTYGSVRVPIRGLPVDSGRTFVGAVIGDFVRTGINQSLATGAVIGLASSVARPAEMPQVVPSFRFMTDVKDEPYEPARALQVAQRMMARRRVQMSPAEENYFLQLSEIAARMECL
jgi:UDP-N-acetylglucosamine diphosphorylase/glucosamine-1-phosphate N-acetyltransferase